MRSKLSLYTDTLLFFLAVGLFTFSIFRFYIRSLWICTAVAFGTSAAATCLFFLFRSHKLQKSSLNERECRNAEKLAFYLALQDPSVCNSMIFNALNETVGSKNNDTYIANQDKFIQTENGLFYPCFRLDKVTADQLRPILRAEETPKTVLAADYTPEARKVAAAYDIRLMDAKDTYSLLKEKNCLPDPASLPVRPKDGFKHKIIFRIRKKAWRGYAFSGISLLIFSFFTFFPVYYIVSGSILLTASIVIRLFGTDGE